MLADEVPMRALVLFLPFVLLACRPAREAVPQEGEKNAPRLVAWATGLSRPVGLVALPDGSGLLVVEKTGKVRRLVDGKPVGLPVLDVSTRVTSGSEQGLLGLALHPKFMENRRIVVNYTGLSGATQIVEWTLSAELVARPETERLLLTIDQPYANHNGGNLVFGPDGKLWVGTGDGGSANDPKGNAQNPTSLLGKMLRLDVDAAEPRPEIAARGLRNPWRYAFDPKTDDLYIADVGQNRWEWVHVVPRARIDGLNFGWDIVEGNGHCVVEGCDAAGLVKPVIEYSHAEGCSITGGVVYRGKALPSLEGMYFYSDFCSAMLRSFRFQGGAATEQKDWKATIDPEKKLSQPSAFGVDLDGEMYVLSLTGVIWKIAPR